MFFFTDPIYPTQTPIFDFVTQNSPKCWHFENSVFFGEFWATFSKIGVWWGYMGSVEQKKYFLKEWFGNFHGGCESFRSIWQVVLAVERWPQPNGFCTGSFQKNHLSIPRFRFWLTCRIGLIFATSLLRDQWHRFWRKFLTPDHFYPPHHSNFEPQCPGPGPDRVGTRSGPALKNS